MNKSEEGRYTFIDLFAGIGGFHLAFHDAGAKCVFASEWNEFARKTYETNLRAVSPEIFENNKFAGDIMSVKTRNIPKFDIICAGFPCQPFSQAGFKRGFEDERGNLFFTIVNIIKKKRPKAFFLENVRHLEKHDNGNTFAKIREVLEKDLGYSFYYQIVRGTDFNVPQHRPRLFMVGFRNRKIKFNFPEPVGLSQSMSDVFGGECDRKVGYTLRVGGQGSPFGDRRNWELYKVNGEIRKLRVEEGKKMMGLPENYEFPVSEPVAMRQLGNSVIVPAVTAVAKQIVATLDEYYGSKNSESK